MPKQLKLRAADEEDISVISACLQDALVQCENLSFLPGERRFVMLAKRFKWEHCPEFMKDSGPAAAPCESYERTNCVVVFDDVTGVRLLDLKKPPGCDVLELLAIAVEPADEEGDSGDPARLVLFFGGGGVIRLEVGRILCHLEDLGEPWTTSRRPCHPLDEAE
ncbi:MAG: DUF2948 family protein [Alphaproteobacteria bacterium]